MPTRRFALCLLSALAFSLALSEPADAQARNELVIATTGGLFERQMRINFYEPFEKRTGIKVIAVSGSGADQIARVKAMQEARHVSWDMYLSGDIQSGSELHKTLNEDFEWFCGKLAGRDDLLPGTCKASGLLADYGTTLLVYNRDKFPAKAPRTWADFWNVKEFPGPRALPNFNDPWRVLAAALLADGVPPAQLFPLDVDRAFRKMDAIKPHVGLWWKTGDQSTQGFRNDEYVMGMIWQTRATALKNEKQPLEWSQDQAVLVGDRFSLIRNAPNRDNAIRFLEFFVGHIEGQAGFCEAVNCTPISRRAAAMMSPAAQATLPLAPGVFERLIIPDAGWINENNARLLQRWNQWVAN